MMNEVGKKRKKGVLVHKCVVIFLFLFQRLFFCNCALLASDSLERNEDGLTSSKGGKGSLLFGLDTWRV